MISFRKKSNLAMLFIFSFVCPEFGNSLAFVILLSVIWCRFVFCYLNSGHDTQKCWPSAVYKALITSAFKLDWFFVEKLFHSAKKYFATVSKRKLVFDARKVENKLFRLTFGTLTAVISTYTFLCKQSIVFSFEFVDPESEVVFL